VPVLEPPVPAQPERASTVAAREALMKVWLVIVLTTGPDRLEILFVASLRLSLKWWLHLRWSAANMNDFQVGLCSVQTKRSGFFSG